MNWLTWKKLALIPSAHRTEKLTYVDSRIKVSEGKIGEYSHDLELRKDLLQRKTTTTLTTNERLMN